MSHCSKKRTMMDEDDLLFVDAVLFDDEHDEDDEADDDPAGALVARALNSGRIPEFRGEHGAPRRSAPPGRRAVGTEASRAVAAPAFAPNAAGRGRDGGLDGKRAKFRPLLGAENRRSLGLALARLYALVRDRGLRAAAEHATRRLMSSLAYPLRGMGADESGSDGRRWFPTNRDTAVSTAVVVVFSLLFLTVPSYFFVVTTARASALCFLAVVTLFFDLDEIAWIFPKFVARGLGTAWHCAESRLLLGRAYRGRQWVDDAARGAGDARMERKEKLIKRWGAKFGQRFGGRKLNEKEKEALYASLEKDRVKAAKELDVSENTVEHMVAMNFCYSMLRGDKNGKSKKVREKFRKSAKMILAKVKKKKKTPKESHEKKVMAVPTGSDQVVEFNIPRSETLRQRSLTWPYAERPWKEETGKEAVEVVLDGEKSRHHSKRVTSDHDGNGLILNVSSQDGGCSEFSEDDDNEGFEVIDSNQHAAVRMSKSASLRLFCETNMNPARSVGNHKRCRSDSDMKYLLNADDESMIRSPGSNGDILSVLSSSLDELEEYDSATTASGRRNVHSEKGNSMPAEKEVDWLDVGAKIGARLLNSEKLQRVMANPSEAEKLLKVLGKPNPGPGLDKVLGDSHAPNRGADDEPLTRLKEGLSPLTGAVRIEEESVHTPISPLGMENDGARMIRTPPSDVAKPVHAIWTSAGAAVSPDSHASNSTCLSDSAALGAESEEEEDRFEGEHSQCDSPEKDPKSGSREQNTCDRNPRDPRKSHHSLNASRFLPPSMALRNRNDTTDVRPCIPTLDDAVFPRKSMVQNHSNLTKRHSLPSLATPLNSPSRRRSDHATPDRLTPAPGGTPSQQLKRRRIIPAGVKMVVPICPVIPTGHTCHGERRRRIAHQSGSCHFQMATVVSSKRIFVSPSKPTVPPSSLYDAGGERLYIHSSCSMEERGKMSLNRNNCLSVTVQLDKSFLRDGRFAEMTFRVMDEWIGRQYMPRHSKYPIGSCIATSFGIGVLVGWRVEDDCHVVRSLWRRRGAGSALAYLNRDSLHGVVEAAVGFEVETPLGRGDVVAYVNGGPEFRRGKFFVLIKQRSRHQGNVLEFSRSDILSCRAAKFIPVIEQIKESAKYQIQIHNYELMLRERSLEKQGNISDEKALWNNWSEGFELIMSSFIRAVEEDLDVNKWLSSIITFLESLDFHGNLSIKKNELKLPESTSAKIRSTAGRTPKKIGGTTSKGNVAKPGTGISDDNAPPGLWFFDDLFGGIFFKSGREEDDAMSDISSVTNDLSVRSDSRIVCEGQSSDSYTAAYAFIRTALRTVAIARASVPGRPNLQMGLYMCHEVILFIRTVIKVQEKNMSPRSVKAWKRTFDDIVATFGPLKNRLEKLGSGIAERLAEQGKIAKLRVIRFVDILMLDDLFLQSLESGAWDQTIARIQIGLVRAGVIDRKTSQQYLKTAQFIFSNLAPRASSNEDAAARNGEKLAHFAMALKWMASPQRSFLALFTRDDVLELIERLMVRVYQKDSEACNMLNIYAFNFHSFRHLRIVNNMAISGKLWKPVLDAADEEFSWAVSRMPENVREYVEPISSLFSLGVARFRQVKANDLTSDWLDFLMEDEAVKIIQQLDLKLILNLESFCNDLKTAMVVLPYYSSIDDDILKLIDEVELEKILKEAAEALVDADRFSHYVREKSALAIKRFLDYLPKMSIPVEKRDLGEGWVLTCRDKHGGDLRLSDVCIEREYMTCNVIGSGNILSPADIFGDGISSSPSWLSPSMSDGSFDDECNVEISVLNDIADLIRNAQQHGSWQPGIGGVDKIANGRAVDPAFDGLPVSEVLKCGIELWKNLEIDDEELMEIAIRDVSYQIQLQKELEEGTECTIENEKWASGNREVITHNKRGSHVLPDEKCSLLHRSISVKTIHDPDVRNRRRFNPRKDPTVLFLEMNKVTCHLDEFLFRVEQRETSTIFDPVFEGLGSLTIKNLSIKLRVECRKERINKLGAEVSVPVLHLQELDIQLEKVKVKFKDTGADWLLNKITKGFRDNITEAVEVNVKEQIGNQIQVALEHLNSYIEVNPDLMLKILGITIDDLEENVIWV